MDRKNTFLMELNIFLRGRKDMTSARMVDIARTYFAGAAKDWFLNVYASRCRDLGIDPLGGDIDKQVLAPRGVHVQEPIFRSSCQVSSCDINHSSRRHVHVRHRW